MSRIPCVGPLLLLLLFKATKVVLSKQEEEKPKKKLEPLGAVVFSFLDKNRDKKVTIPEMNNQLMILEEISKEGGEGDEETGELRLIFKRLKKAAPYIFNLLDQDEDRRLDRDEAKVITQFEESLNHNGNAKIMLREWFEILDDDVDERLDADEILESTKSNFIIGEIAGTMYQFYPLRDTAFELRKHIRRAMAPMWGEELDRESVTEGMKWLDYDGDGYIQWSELIDAYTSFGKTCSF